jgi:hypothetical protein
MVVRFEDFTCGQTHHEWIKKKDGSGPEIQETSQAVEITIPADAVGNEQGLFRAYLFLNSALSEDFDIQVDYSLISRPPNRPTGVRVGLVAIANELGGPAVERVSGYGPIDQYGEVYLTHFADGIFHTNTIDDQKGKLRMVRKGTTLVGYYFDHTTDNWTPIHEGSVSSPKELLHLSIAVWSHKDIFQHEKAIVVFENVIINKGILVCHQI